MPEPRIHEGEVREHGVIGDEAFRDRRDGDEIGIERVDAELTTEAQIPELFSLDDTRVVGLASDAPRGDSLDELLEFVAEAGAFEIEGEKFGKLTGRDVRHEKLQFLTSVPAPFGNECGYSENSTAWMQ
jgi:hypothetical protein